MDILGLLLSYVLLYRYYALGAVIYSAAVILPLPTNALLLAVGAFASQGYFSFWWSLALAVGANTLGDLTDYGLAKKYGMAAVRKLKLDKVRFFGQLAEELRVDAAVNIVVTRLAGSLSIVANFLSGIVGVPFWRFFFYDILGNLIEPGVALTLGYLAGDYWNSFSGILKTFAGLAAVGIITFILFRIYRRIDKKYSDEPVTIDLPL